MNNNGVPVLKVLEKVNLEVIYKPSTIDNLFVTSINVNKAGLYLVDSFDDFDSGAIYIFGKEEIYYLKHMDSEKRSLALNSFFKLKPLLIVFTGEYIQQFPEVKEMAKKYAVLCTKTNDQTTSIMFEIVKFLNFELAPKISMHGELLVIYGEGVLITGDSRIGKSETAIELIKRGHCLVADDVVETRKIFNKKVIGSAPEYIRNFIELRGVGFINVEKMFGMNATKPYSQIDFAIEMVNMEKFFSTNITNAKAKINILGVEVPLTKIPVQSGRNIATMVEVATMTEKQQKSGYNATKTLLNDINEYWKENK